jgi:CheY-like chemotaxis protein
MNLDGLTTGQDRPTDFLNACILIVERDDASAEIMLHFLRSAGYRNALSIVGSGSVLDLLYELDIDLVLIDNEVLVNIDGTDILEQIRNNAVHRHLPVIVLTADNSRVLRLRVLG